MGGQPRRHGEPGRVHRHRAGTRGRRDPASSLYGHGEIDCDGFRRRCTERGLGDILLYLGGNLVVGKASHEAVMKKFAAMGFDGVFTAADDLDEVAARLKADLEKRGAPLPSPAVPIFRRIPHGCKRKKKKIPQQWHPPGLTLPSPGGRGELQMTSTTTEQSNCH